MTRILPGIIAMAAIVVASNILVQFLILDGLLTWGAFTYPLAFLVTDVMNRVYGPQTARKVVFAGFVTGVFCSLIGTQIQGEFGPLVTLRIALGSGIAFLTAQLLDDMTDTDSDKNVESRGQGVANIATGFLGGMDARQHLIYLSPARQRLKFLGVQGIDADIDPLQAGRCQ